uniref:Putative secreted protein n=1 Tax=Anopheles marajoara TaxID=58244 RepID=A0A2M4CDB1_9DIPT
MMNLPSCLSGCLSALYCSLSLVFPSVIAGSRYGQETSFSNTPCVWFANTGKAEYTGRAHRVEKGRKQNGNKIV